jgi:hypothetical protein
MSLVARGIYEIAADTNRGNTAPQRIVLLKSEIKIITVHSLIL